MTTPTLLLGICSNEGCGCAVGTTDTAKLAGVCESCHRDQELLKPKTLAQIAEGLRPLSEKSARSMEKIRAATTEALIGEVTDEAVANGELTADEGETMRQYLTRGEPKPEDVTSPTDSGDGPEEGVALASSSNPTHGALTLAVNAALTYQERVGRMTRVAIAIARRYHNVHSYGDRWEDCTHEMCSASRQEILEATIL